MRGGRWLGVLTLLTLQVCAGAARAAKLSVAASRSEMLYAQAQDADCTALSTTPSSALPLYISRITASAPLGVSPDQIRFQWDLPEKGVFLADQNLGPDQQASVITGLCADVGNGCTLTAEQLAVYNRPSILWVAPTCAVLPDQTSKPFPGGKVRLSVRVFKGKRRIGKGATSVGFGRLASLTLFVADPGKPFRNGQGTKDEKIFLNPAFAGRFRP